MATSVSKAGPYYSSGEIKFSSLRSNFRAQIRKSSSGGSETFNTDTAAISASSLRRNTNNSSTSPIVPNATENVNISSSSDWKTSQFRNSIKYYYISQSGTDTNLDIDGLTWNGNLGRNINKFMFIDGTCGSSSVTSAAAEFAATTYNLTIDVYGNILGAGGRGGGTSGAPAISGESGGNALAISSSGGNNIVVFVRSTARIYGGGGGGEKGATGANGTSGTCYEYYYINQCSTGAPSCPGGWNQISSGWGCCTWRRGCAVARWTRTCERTYSTSAGTGGDGGTGGPGRGYNNPSGSLSGSAGTAGTSGGGCGSTAGTNGETGGDGGLYGSSGGNTGNSGTGGTAGRAISGSNYSVDGTLNTDTLKGLYQP